MKRRLVLCCCVVSFFAAVAVWQTGVWNKFFHTPAFVSAGNKHGTEDIPDMSVTFPKGPYGYRIGDIVQVLLTIEERAPVDLDLTGLPRTGERLGVDVPCEFWSGIDGKLKNPSIGKKTVKGVDRYEILFFVQCFMRGEIPIMFPAYELYFESLKNGRRPILTPSGTATVFWIERTVPSVPMIHPISPVRLKARPKFWIAAFFTLAAISCLALIFKDGVRFWRAWRWRYSPHIEALSPLREEVALMRRVSGLAPVESFVGRCLSDGLIPSERLVFATRILDGESLENGELDEFFDAIDAEIALREAHESVDLRAGTEETAQRRRLTWLK